MWDCPIRRETNNESNRDWTSQPAFIDDGYKSTTLRGPTRPLLPIPESLSELTGPVYGHEAVGEFDADLTKNSRVNGEPLGERIIVAGRVVDEDDHPVANTLVESGRQIPRAVTCTTSISMTRRWIRTFWVPDAV